MKNETCPFPNETIGIPPFLIKCSFGRRVSGISSKCRHKSTFAIQFEEFPYKAPFYSVDKCLIPIKITWKRWVLYRWVTKSGLKSPPPNAQKVSTFHQRPNLILVYLGTIYLGAMDIFRMVTNNGFRSHNTKSKF
jgi:hypothetical protein